MIEIRIPNDRQNLSSDFLFHANVHPWIYQDDGGVSKCITLFISLTQETIIFHLQCSMSNINCNFNV